MWGARVPAFLLPELQAHVLPSTLSPEMLPPQAAAFFDSSSVFDKVGMGFPLDRDINRGSRG